MIIISFHYGSRVGWLVRWWCTLPPVFRCYNDKCDIKSFVRIF